MDEKCSARYLSPSGLKEIESNMAHRFLHASEIYSLLHSFRRYGLHKAGSSCDGIQTQPPCKPRSGSWFLFAPGARLRNDGHSYEKRVHKGFLITREQHVKLNVPRPNGTGSFPAVRGYYSVQGSEEPQKAPFVRRIYWLLDSEWPSFCGSKVGLVSQSSPKKKTTASNRGGTGSSVDQQKLDEIHFFPIPPNDGTLDRAVRGVALVHYLAMPDQACQTRIRKVPSESNTLSLPCGSVMVGHTQRKSLRNIPHEMIKEVDSDSTNFPKRGTRCVGIKRGRHEIGSGTHAEVVPPPCLSNEAGKSKYEGEGGGVGWETTEDNTGEGEEEEVATERLLEKAASFLRQMGSETEEAPSPGPPSFLANFKDSSGNTLLHAAALLGSLEMCQTLIAAGSSIGAKNYTGKTPFELAADSSKRSLAPILLAQPPHVQSTLISTTVEEHQMLHLAAATSLPTTAVHQQGSIGAPHINAFPPSLRTSSRILALAPPSNPGPFLGEPAGFSSNGQAAFFPFSTDAVQNPSPSPTVSTTLPAAPPVLTHENASTSPWQGAQALQKVSQAVQLLQEALRRRRLRLEDQKRSSAAKRLLQEALRRRRLRLEENQKRRAAAKKVLLRIILKRRQKKGPPSAPSVPPHSSTATSTALVRVSRDDLNGVKGPGAFFAVRELEAGTKILKVLRRLQRPRP